MKIKILTLVAIAFMSIIVLNGQDKEVKAGMAGVWKFEAPYAPEGYTAGNISILFADKKYTTTMTFTGSETKLTGENVKVAKDSIFFSVYVEGQNVNVKLKLDAETKMSGKAIYTEGEVPLTLIKGASAGEAKK